MTSEGNPQSCPSPEILHRLVEGNLSPTVARGVVRHAEECRDCRFIIGEAFVFLGEEIEISRRAAWKSRSRRKWWGLAVATAVLAAVFVAQFLVESRPEPLFDQAWERTSSRLIEGRLSGVSYRRHAATRSEMPSATPHMRALADSVLAEPEPPPANALAWHRRGIASLVRGDLLDAVASLARATHAAPRDARYWNDLAAARLALGTAQHDDAFLNAAMQDATRAVHLDPTLLEAQFNVALVLERRQITDEAAAAYARYLAFDPDSPWAEEARSRRANLHR